MQSLTKTFLAFVLAVFSTCLSYAQIFDKTKGKNVQRLYNQTTNVYLYGEGPYSERLKNAFNSHWKITPFKFHDISKGLPSLESESSVFMPVVVGLLVRDHATAMNHPFYVFAEGGTSGRVNAEGIVAAFPVNGFHYEFDVTADSMYSRTLLRAPYIVYTLNEMLTYLKEKGSDKDFFKTIDSRTAEMTGKTLLVPAELLSEWNVNPNVTALMKADLKAGQKPMKQILAAILEQGEISYGGMYKVMPTTDILKLEQSAEAGKYTLFLPAINDKKYIMVFDLQTKKLLYYETVGSGMKIKEKDFNKLNKAAGL